MANHSFRSAVVLVLLIGTFALAVPYVSSTLDGWLFSEGETKPKWNTQRPSTAESPAPKVELRPANPQLVPPGKSEQVRHGESEPAPLAFDFQEDTTPAKDSPTIRPIQRTEHLDSAAAIRDVNVLKRELQDLGAAYMAVEELEGRYECRSLFPLTAESSYQKAFSGFGSTPEAAMEQVLAEVRAWQRAAQGVK